MDHHELQGVGRAGLRESSRAAPSRAPRPHWNTRLRPLSRQWSRPLIAVFAVVALLATACSGGSSEAEAEPTETGAEADPTETGANPLIERLVERADAARVLAAHADQADPSNATTLASSTAMPDAGKTPSRNTTLPSIWTRTSPMPT